MLKFTVLLCLFAVSTEAKDDLMAFTKAEIEICQIKKNLSDSRLKNRDALFSDDFTEFDAKSWSDIALDNQASSIPCASAITLPQPGSNTYSGKQSAGVNSLLGNRVQHQLTTVDSEQWTPLNWNLSASSSLSGRLPPDKRITASTYPRQQSETSSLFSSNLSVGLAVEEKDKVSNVNLSSSPGLSSNTTMLYDPWGTLPPSVFNKKASRANERSKRGSFNLIDLGDDPRDFMKAFDPLMAENGDSFSDDSDSDLSSSEAKCDGVFDDDFVPFEKSALVSASVTKREDKDASSTPPVIPPARPPRPASLVARHPESKVKYSRNSILQHLCKCVVLLSGL